MENNFDRISNIDFSAFSNEAGCLLKSDNERQFLGRIYSGDMSRYLRRVKMIGFSGLKNILDAGCGFGQWSLALARENESVIGIEYDETRVSVCKKLQNFVPSTNISFDKGSVESLDFPDKTFDGIFSYSVILCTDYKKALKEFSRVLKPGGKLYLTTNGLGWYLYNLLEGHNDAVDFSSKKMAIDAIENTLNYYATGIEVAGKSIITPSNVLKNELIELGFKDIKIAGDGRISLNGDGPIPFFDAEKYQHESVWEVLCTKI